MARSRPHPGYLGSQDTFYIGTIKGAEVIRTLTDCGTEYCGKPETHDYQFYLALNDIEHSRTKANHPQRYLRAFPQNHLAGVLSSGIPA